MAPRLPKGGAPAGAASVFLGPAPLATTELAGPLARIAALVAFVCLLGAMVGWVRR